MANLKNITELPMAESAEGLNLIVNDNGYAKQIAASAVGAQADWSEMDDNSASYIKNRPFWTGETDYITLIDKLALNFSSTGFYGQKKIDPIEIIENEKYFITFDDEQYECIAFHHSYGNCASLGDANRMAGSGEGLPFFITNSGNNTVVFSGISGEHTISIIKETVDIHKIDEKYLPKFQTANIKGYDFNAEVYVIKEYTRPFILHNYDYYNSENYNYSDYIGIDNEGALTLPLNERFCRIEEYSNYIDVSNASKGETISSVLTSDWYEYSKIVKAYYDNRAIIRATIIDAGQSTPFYIHPNSSITVITSENRVCRVKNEQCWSSEDNDYYIEFTVTVLGTLNLF